MDWIANMFVLLGVFGVSQGRIRLMVPALFSGIVGDVIYIYLGLLWDKPSLVALNVCFVILSLYGIYRWRKRSAEIRIREEGHGQP